MSTMDTDAFLAQEIASSSPARLRFLLIQKAVGLCQIVESQWTSGEYAQSAQWTIRIQDILSELLDGVQAANNPLAAQVSDIYVYVLKLFANSVQERDLQGLQAAREILEVEQVTWSQYVANETKQSATSDLALNSHFESNSTPSFKSSQLANSTAFFQHDSDDDEQVLSLDLQS